MHCRKVVGKDYPIMVRISGNDFTPGGITPREAQRTAEYLEEWGVNAIHVTAGTHETQEMTVQPMSIPRGCLVPLANEIKKVVRIPVAAGALPAKPDTPGMDYEKVITAWEALEDPQRLGEHVVVIGGGSVGAETAEFLAGFPKEITLVEMLKEVACDVEINHRKLLLRRLGEKGVKIRVRTQVREIRPDGVMLEFSGQQEMLSADTVVLAAGAKENRELKETQQQLQVEFYAIGDCREARKALEAIHEGFQTALHL